MRIQHNILAMNAYRNYNTNANALSKNLEKLSSGYKINRAGDDAAGLAISEKMRAQITGLDAATKNVKDGVSLVKTAEGAMQEIQDMLNRMDYLATQSANGTYDNEVDRANLQKEVESLQSEINRIADSANFNGIKLLDGSLDKNATGIGAVEASAITIADLATDPTNPATGTITKTSGKEAAKTSFDVELHDVSIDAKDGDTIKLTIGTEEISLAVGAVGDAVAGTADIDEGKLDASDLATAIVAKINDAAGLNGKIGGQDFTVTANVSKLSFVQANDPTSADEVVSANMEVKLTYTGAGAGATVAGTAPDLTVVAGTDSDWNTGTAVIPSDTNVTNVTGASTLDTNALLAALNAADPTETTELSISFDAGSNKFQIKAGTHVLGTSQEIQAGDKVVANNGTFTINFETADATSLGSVTLTNADATTDLTVNAYTGGNIGLKGDGNGTAAKTATVTVDNTKLLEAAGDNAGNVNVEYTAGKYELTVGGAKIAEGTFAGNKVTFVDNNGDAIVTLDGTAGTTTDAEFQVALGTAQDLGIDVQAAPAAGSKSGTWNIGTTNNVQGNEKMDTRLASTYFELKKDMITDGGRLTIGKDTYTFKVGADSEVEDGDYVIDLSALTADEIANEATLVDKAGEALSKAFAGKSAGTFTLGYDANQNRVSIHEVEDQTDYTKGELESVGTFAKLLSYGGTDGENGSPLTLQIGDTADDFNQLKVSVGDMHTNAMGAGKDVNGNDSTKTIADVDISTQDGAQEAVQIIKNAINYVSSVRGDLGAIQNRLEHTSNNLSVMKENITDAESTIRDTDIADEMTAYTKNNILLQSAQAMLAQANQVPQGVLQLLG